MPAQPLDEKGQAKASAKFEPQVFRDALVKHLSSSSPSDFEDISQKLDALGSQLDYRKYEEQLFQILLVGAILAPGGNIVEDGGVGRCTFSVVAIGGDEPKTDVKEMKKAIGVFDRLMRRYKYLQHHFEETALKQIIGYMGRFTALEQERLAVASALFVSAGLAPVNILGSVRSAHLVKEGTAQTFLLTFLKTLSATAESLDPLLLAFRKTGLADLDAFFPPGKRATADVTAALKNAGAASVADWYVKIKSAGTREEVNKKVRSLLADNADADEITAAVEPIFSRAVPSTLSEGDFASLVFLALVSRVNLNAEGAAVVDEAVKQVEEFGVVLEPFVQKAVSEVALINTIQLWVHENPKLQPAFLKILKALVGEDVISTGPLSFWYSKGSKPQGREQLLAKAKPLVEFLQRQEEEEDSDEE
ncbi:hypothetical protein JCM10213v2_004837 [Rhodosporidiobolus nylandii]